MRTLIGFLFCCVSSLVNIWSGALGNWMALHVIVVVISGWFVWAEDTKVLDGLDSLDPEWSRKVFT